MKILVTGSAGFIGFHLAKRLVQEGHEVVGLDNLNNYYDVKLKLDRLQDAGIESQKIAYNEPVVSSKHPNYTFIQLGIEDAANLERLFFSQKFDRVCHLAAQAGVRYSIKHPEAYIQSNIVGFFNILESSRHHHIQHLVFASSSSVYGDNLEVPFKEDSNTDAPISFYAATKKSNELMAHTYSHLYNIPMTGLRFFTVYGPWGRPDMAYSLFTKAILEGQPIKVFNEGKLSRDFTYVDDIVEGIVRILTPPPTNLNPETLNPETLKPQTSNLNTSHLNPSNLNPQTSNLNTSTLNPQTLKPQTSNLNTSHLNPQTLNPQTSNYNTSTLNPQTSNHNTSNLNSSILNPQTRFRIYNIGNSRPTALMDFITAIEDELGIEAKKEYLPMQPGDVETTFADVSELMRDFGYQPKTSVREGIAKFVRWYLVYHQAGSKVFA